MTRWWWLVATALLGSCGKLAPKPHGRTMNVASAGGSAALTGGSAGDAQAGEESSGASGAATGGLSGGSAQGVSGTGAGRGGGGAGGRSSTPGGRGGREMSPYEPSDPDQPPQGDGTLLGGSVEGGYGDGWDACGSKHAGLNTAPTGDASDGSRYLLFDSSLPCEGCSERTSDLQVIFWFDSPIQAGKTQYLYFDVVSFSMGRPTGSLVLGSFHPPGTDPCTTTELLATVPLTDLATSAEWQTRCVAFTPVAAYSIFGLYVADGTFEIGLDTLRFGPPCR
jgi:hypothetical protein